jgi:hypothetical protein
LVGVGDALEVARSALISGATKIPLSTTARRSGLDRQSDEQSDSETRP